ncbi:hypothetical protein DLAC_02930 [Tieghemostelium lacteum]|uniref:Uncharacterized protein n=1 Tax=Tieghemostelium lacteum TaxID=361077 RepID=A0A152A3N0_TIELA|nr:hypothetical protein DLAC_02930 [Tieghemostelium lacteum]|eukprot:KYR00872.1 hypothetical protein DLAC_02930 [Tieghemostelium lacteum]
MDTTISSSEIIETTNNNNFNKTELIKKLKLNNDEIKLFGYLSFLESLSPVYKEIFYQIKDNPFFSIENRVHLNQVFQSLEDKGLILCKEISIPDNPSKPPVDFVFIIKGPYIVDLIKEFRDETLGLIDYNQTYRDLAILYGTYDYPFSDHVLVLLHQIGRDGFLYRLKLDERQRRKLIFALLRDDGGSKLETSVFSQLVEDALATYIDRKMDLIDDPMASYFFKYRATLIPTDTPDYQKLVLDNLLISLNLAMEYCTKDQIDPIPEFVAEIYSSIGQFYRSMEKTKESIPYLEKAVLIHKNLPYFGNGLTSTLRLADSYLGNDQFQVAADHYELVFNFTGSNGVKVRDIKDYQFRGTILRGLASCYLHLKRFDESIELSKEALELEKHIPDQVFVHTNQIAVAYHWAENYSEALKYYLKLIEMTQLINSQLYGIAYGTLANCYQQTNQYSKALAAYEKAQKINKEKGIKIEHSKDIEQLKKQISKSKQLSLTSVINRNRSFFFWTSVASVAIIGIFKFLKNK